MDNTRVPLLVVIFFPSSFSVFSPHAVWKQRNTKNFERLTRTEGHHDDTPGARHFMEAVHVH